MKTIHTLRDDRKGRGTLDGGPRFRGDDTGHGGKKEGKCWGLGVRTQHHYRSRKIGLSNTLTPTLILFCTMPCHPGEGRDRPPNSLRPIP